ncbi:hypothetical protein ABPG77_009861 [Micractinium sp. CCAP 211/92]
MPHRQNGAARAVAARALPPPGRRPAQRAANAAAAASVAALPSSATGEYLDAYPAVKRLLQRFKVELRVDQFPLQLLNEYANRLMYQVVWTFTQESLMGGFRVEVRLTSKRDGETLESGTGLARNKQAGKQVAAAACLERLLATAVDEESLLRPDSKADSKKKSWQAPQRPGLGADPAPNDGGSGGGFRGAYGSSGYGSARRYVARRPSFGSPGFVRGGTMVPIGAGFELQPTPGSAAGQLSSFEAASLPNAGKQFTSSGAVRAPSQASTGSDANGRSGGSSGAEVAQAGFGSQGPPPAPPSLQRPSSPRPPQFRFAYGDPEQEAQRAEQQEAFLRQWQAQQGAAGSSSTSSLTSIRKAGSAGESQP